MWLGKGQLHKLQEANCEAFHTGKTHPAWWEGCTCADQWICGKCGTWHQHGKRVWSWKGEFLEDMQCRECKEPRPDPLPKVRRRAESRERRAESREGVGGRSAGQGDLGRRMRNGG